MLWRLSVPILRLFDQQFNCKIAAEKRTKFHASRKRAIFFQSLTANSNLINNCWSFLKPETDKECYEELSVPILRLFGQQFTCKIAAEKRTQFLFEDLAIFFFLPT